MVAQMNDELEKMRNLVAKESKAVDQLTQQSERINEEIRNVSNLISFEAAKLAKGQIDE